MWKWLKSTRELQAQYFNVNYDALEGDELADYITWNSTALTTELGEFLQEIGWKPWASPRGWYNRDKAVGELVDVAHFLANLACALDVTDDEWEARYQTKQEINRQRMSRPEGYSGHDKCVACGRAFDDDDVHCYRRQYNSDDPNGPQIVVGWCMEEGMIDDAT